MAERTREEWNQADRDVRLLEACRTLAQGYVSNREGVKRARERWVAADHQRLQAVEEGRPQGVIDARAERANEARQHMRDMEDLAFERTKGAAEYIRKEAAKSAPPEPEEDDENPVGRECAEGGHINDDNDGRPICRTCDDDPNIAALYPARWVSIVFIDGDEGHELVRKLERAEGVVYHGATDESIAEAVAYLKDWDYGDESEVNITDEPQWGASDYLARVDDYVLAWHTGLGYVSLNRRVQ